MRYGSYSRLIKRLQVLMDDDELRDIQRPASRQRVTTESWVRQRLRDALESEGRGDVGAKLAAIDAAYAHQGPTADIDEMLAEIERR